MRPNVSTKNLKVKDGPVEATPVTGVEAGKVVFSGGGTYWDVDTYYLDESDNYRTQVGAVARINNLATPHHVHLKWQGRFEMYPVTGEITTPPDLEANLAFALNAPGGGFSGVPAFTYEEGMISSLRVSFRTLEQPVINVFLSGVAIIPAGTSYISPWFGSRVKRTDSDYSLGREGVLYQQVKYGFEEWDIRILAEANLEDSTNGTVADAIEADATYAKTFSFPSDDFWTIGYEDPEITEPAGNSRYQFGIPGYPNASMGNSFHWEPFLEDESFPPTGGIAAP